MPLKQSNPRGTRLRENTHSNTPPDTGYPLLITKAKASHHHHSGLPLPIEAQEQNITKKTDISLSLSCYQGIHTSTKCQVISGAVIKEFTTPRYANVNTHLGLHPSDSLDYFRFNENCVSQSSLNHTAFK
ncbi:hypothetical protein VTL71DRAFT_853 [Oculimacula yallundae]|uniref:Uncharacterized protein n=1 Tax=Oculimacula yallundae TaxID=86028 RepID=A0ABR4D168_9HELO